MNFLPNFFTYHISNAAQGKAYGQLFFLVTILSPHDLTLFRNGPCNSILWLMGTKMPYSLTLEIHILFL